MPQTLNEWVKRSEIDSGVREGITTSEAQRLKNLEREVMRTDFVLDALELALYDRQPERDGTLTHHSDRGLLIHF